MACPLARTAQGFEMQFATNHLGHFLLAGLLAPALLRGAPSRVVSVSSRGHRFSPVVFEDIHFERRPYDKWSAYGQSKTANVLFAVELDRRLRARACAPTRCIRARIVTELGRHLQPTDIAELQSRAPGGRMEWKTVPVRRRDLRVGGHRARARGQGGLYLEDCQIARAAQQPDRRGRLRGLGRDPDAAARLWSVSEQMLGERFALGEEAQRQPLARVRPRTRSRRKRRRGGFDAGTSRRQGGDRDGRGVGHRRGDGAQARGGGRARRGRGREPASSARALAKEIGSAAVVRASRRERRGELAASDRRHRGALRQARRAGEQRGHHRWSRPSRRPRSSSGGAIHAVNAEGVFLGCKHAIPAMRRAGGGSIVNVSSLAALRGTPIYAAYSASKGAVRSLTKTVALHCRERGEAIRCNSIHPGGVDTPMVRGGQAEHGRSTSRGSRCGRASFAGRRPSCQPVEIANLILYLASDESRFVNGEELAIDGGLTASVELTLAGCGAAPIVSRELIRGLARDSARLARAGPRRFPPSRSPPCPAAAAPRSSSRARSSSAASRASTARASATRWGCARRSRS